MLVLMPSDDRDDHFHAAQIRGLMGFRQTRPGMRWVVNQSVPAPGSLALLLGASGLMSRRRR